MFFSIFNSYSTLKSTYVWQRKSFNSTLQLVEKIYIFKAITATIFFKIAVVLRSSILFWLINLHFCAFSESETVLELFLEDLFIINKL